MKRLWWVSVLVFLVGIGVGSGIAGFAKAGGENLPYFSASPPEIAKPAITEPMPTAKPLQGNQEGLPWSLQYTSLVAQTLLSYDGPYWEEGATEDVFGVTALLLQNTSTNGIAYARVQLTQDGQELYFDATYIPPKASVLILEENRALFSDSPVTDCQCKTVIPGDFDMEQRQVAVKDDGLTGLSVTNLTEKTLSCVWVYYKHYDASEDLCLGGITYSVMLSELLPGESRILRPYRYAAGYSKAVAVIVE